MVQKVDDTDDTIPLAKVSLLIKEKKLPEATQLLQVREENKIDENKLYLSFRNFFKMINNNVFHFIVV
jgi:hypothetical protein